MIERLQKNSFNVQQIPFKLTKEEISFLFNIFLMRDDINFLYFLLK